MGQYRQPSPTRGCAITNDRRILMVRSIVVNRATSGSDQRPMYDQLLRPIVRAIVASCDRAYDQSWHPTTDGTINCGVQLSIARSIVATYDRSYDQSWHQTTDHPRPMRPVIRSFYDLSTIPTFFRSQVGRNLVVSPV